MNKRFLLLLMFLFPLGVIFASNEHHAAENKLEKEEFKAGEFIFDHIIDSHEWHVATYKETHISIPLPVIVYSKTSGLHIFMSSKLHHGHSPFEFDGGQLKLMLEGENKGKIVEFDQDGQQIENMPIDISITKNVAGLFFSLALMLWLFITVARTYARRKGEAPSGMQNFIETIIIFIRDDVAKPTIGKKYERFMPYLLMVFFFILINNLLGLVPLVPGGANVSGNITITFFLAICTFILTNINTTKDFWKHIFNTPGVPWWLKFPLPIMPFVEFLGVFTKPFALMIRLFANITAGHIIVLAFFSLIFIFGNINQWIGYSSTAFTIPFTIFMTMLELLVAFVQAFVFTLLSAVFIGMAMEEHH